MNGSVAKRYAKALFEEAKEQFVDEQVYAHLGTLHSNMKATPDLQMALINPRVPSQKKYSLLLLASGLDPEATTLYTRFLRLLLENHRENKLRLIIFVYRDLYREYHQIDRVVFETAVPVERAMVEKLIQSIKRHTGREVECETKVKPSLIGGFRLRIGDHRYDYSYQYKLEKIKEKLCLTR